MCAGTRGVNAATSHCIPVELVNTGGSGIGAGTELFPHAGGVGTVTVALPNNPLLQHFTFYSQALSFDAAAPNGQVALSNAGELIMY